MVKTIFLQYLLMPLFIIVTGALMVFVRKKNQLLSNRRLIIFILLYSLAMALPSLLAFIPASFTPWNYIIAQLVYLVMGISFVHLYDNFLQKDIQQHKIGFQVLVMALILLLGAYLFAVVFNLVRHEGGYVAATSMFIFCIPLLFYWTYDAFISIPFEIYKVWQYPADNYEEISFDGLDFNRLMVLELEFSRHPDDVDRMRVKAKAPANIVFGEWFRKFLDDYNYKFPGQPITYRNDNGDMQGWVFYTKTSFFHRRKMIDPERTILENKVAEHVTIISKRVIEHNEEYFHSNLKQKPYYS